jgi:hypothetical protein
MTKQTPIVAKPQGNGLRFNGTSNTALAKDLATRDEKKANVAKIRAMREIDVREIAEAASDADEASLKESLGQGEAKEADQLVDKHDALLRRRARRDRALELAEKELAKAESDVADQVHQDAINLVERSGRGYIAAATGVKGAAAVLWKELLGLQAARVALARSFPNTPLAGVWRSRCGGAGHGIPHSSRWGSVAGRPNRG